MTRETSSLLFSPNTLLCKEKNQQLEQPSKIKAGGETLNESRNVENDEQSYSGYLDLQNSTIKEERKMK